MEERWLKDVVELYRQFTDEQENYEKLKEIFKSVAENPDYRLFISEFGGKVVCTMMGVILRNLVGKGRDFMVLENIITDKEFRGIGFAKKLYSEVEQWAKERDCFKIVIISNKKYKDASRFYESVGYESNSSNVFIKHL